MFSGHLIEKIEFRELIKKLSLNMWAFVMVHPYCQLDWTERCLIPQ